MEFSVENGILNGARQCVSPNFNERPVETEISLLVIHSISLPPGEYGHSFVDDFFCNCLDRNSHPYFEKIAEMKVSAHLFINRSGEITQYVNFSDRAWHAGESNFQDVDNCNDYSIGIELEGLEGETFERQQYISLAQLCKLLQKKYPNILPSRICGHSGIAPGRKQDPGEGFDWAYFFSLLDG